MIQVVIVEDDLMVASINKEYVQQTPGMHVVATFHNGQDALEYLKDRDIDLLLLDVYMPDLSGMDLLRQLRVLQKNVDVIMVTAANDTSSIQEALNMGILDYLVKPFQYERFETAIRKYLLKHKLMKQNFTFSQKDVDELIQVQSAVPLTGQPELAKGLQDKTLRLLRSCLKAKKDQSLTCEDLAQETGLSKVTVRRYLNYLVENNEIMSEIDYRTGGRPSVLYRYID